jgi:hypothetical protein
MDPFIKDLTREQVDKLPRRMRLKPIFKEFTRCQPNLID